MWIVIKGGGDVINTIEILEKADLKLIKCFNHKFAISVKAMPVYREKGKVVVVYCSLVDENKEFIEFFYESKVKWLRIKEEVYEELSDWLHISAKDNLIEEILIRAVSKNVSDIHFEPCFQEVKVRFRIHGELILVTKLTLEDYECFLRRVKLKSGLNPYETRKNLDGSLVVSTGKKKYDCRVSTIPVVNGEKLVVRILYGEKRIDLKSLGFNNEDLKEIEKMMELNSGIIIVTGPTGSGKSTTINSILSKLNKGDLNIITIEDPVEIYQEGLNQISIDRNNGLDFANCLRGTLRQDPDIISVGEIRDEETAKIAVRASLSSHKIYTTLHTKNANEAFTRLEEMAIDRNTIINSIGGIISQRLVKLLCPICKKEMKRKDHIPFPIYEKQGCIKCDNTGYKGRSVVSACYFIGEETRKKLKTNNKIEILDNFPMAERACRLFKNGDVGYLEYISFMKGEDLSIDINK